MLHDLAIDVALKRAAEGREGWRHRERMSKPAVQQKTTDDDDGDDVNNDEDGFFHGHPLCWVHQRPLLTCRTPFMPVQCLGCHLAIQLNKQCYFSQQQYSVVLFMQFTLHIFMLCGRGS